MWKIADLDIKKSTVSSSIANSKPKAFRVISFLINFEIFC